MRKMNRADATRSFFDLLEETDTRFPRGDSIGWRMAWSEHIDHLARDGYLTERAAQRGWVAPKMPHRFVTSRVRDYR
jgi:hypothetical protein